MNDTEQERHFRDRARTWLEEHKPKGRRPASGPEMRAFDRDWQSALFNGGWAGIAWPKEHGGQGLSLNLQLIWHEEYARAAAPDAGVNWIALNHAGPTLIAKGTDEQRSRHLEAILSGGETWCQGFSEPGAGSDLASVQTRGVVDGDELVVNGQKIWTTYGNYADFQELLIRTDTAAPKHKGISWVICDMRSPGISIRPIHSLTGRQHFCEVFYDDVRIPLSNVVGGLNNGWSTAMATLGFERGTGFITEQIALARTVEAMIEFARSGPRRLIDSDLVADRLATLRAEVTALRSFTYLMVSRIDTEGLSPFESSVTRLYYAELTKRVMKFAYELFGQGRLQRQESGGIASGGYLDSFRYTIAAGTSEIQRNIIAEKLLHLPRV